MFVKQKTAYEMRISDWSSDVCSSDLRNTGAGTAGRRPAGEHGADAGFQMVARPVGRPARDVQSRRRPGAGGAGRRPGRAAAAVDLQNVEEGKRVPVRVDFGGSPTLTQTKVATTTTPT